MTVQSPKPPLIRVNAVIFIGFPILAAILLPIWGVYAGLTATQWVWAVVFLYLNGLSITGGYHRLWSHKAYDAHWSVRLWFALWGAGALQNSILIWAADHRRHHRHVDDNESDPYSAGRGLWFSHMGWMLREYATHGEDFSNAQDLMRDPIVMWQHKHYVAITTFMNLGLPILLGLALGDVIGTVLLVGLLRLVVNHHVTFFINSLAHFWGTRPYTEENSARDNGFLAFLTYGEGYHNYHHIFQKDYRNGIRWYQWDPTKWMIGALEKLGLASSLQRVPDFRIQRALLDMQFKRAQDLATGRGEPALSAILEREYQIFTDSVNQWKKLQSERYEHHREQIEGAMVERYQQLQHRWEQATLRGQFRELEFSLRVQRKRLQMLVSQWQLQPLGAA
ncbi:fatty acid desaturase [Congregibacter variabilis]|uniref:Fatty acid desaturase n=1 Tax=Congregibacter variabilis TaxID=3081200 RepID=A0ABZ0HXM1_9GAMM|nr:fatty acid desaturase [Congregibacter sp. IMCC43200]